MSVRRTKLVTELSIFLRLSELSEPQIHATDSKLHSRSSRKTFGDGNDRRACQRKAAVRTRYNFSDFG